MKKIVPKGELLSYGFCEFGEEDERNRWVARKDLLVKELDKDESEKDAILSGLESETESYYMRNHGLSFTEAFCLLKKGYCVRRAEWLGYWEPVGGNNIVMHCKDGRQVDMSKGCIPMFTLEHTLAHDWLLVDEAHKAELDRIHESGVCGPAADQVKAAKILAENLKRRD